MERDARTTTAVTAVDVARGGRAPQMAVVCNCAIIVVPSSWQEASVTLPDITIKTLLVNNRISEDL